MTPATRSNKQDLKQTRSQTNKISSKWHHHIIIIHRKTTRYNYTHYTDIEIGSGSCRRHS